ncbi:heavy metal translocating P-type ATPase [Photobacterium makurazakiensis]|uniref:heavy metal translocating P-type ATPase n=1 Tax=Photobacterium makurazakiensis TaxID=2910234 RepID=UPI003D0C4BF2
MTENDTLIKEKTWSIGNMDCPSCISKLDNIIRNIDDVKDVRITFSTKKLTAKFSLTETIKIIENSSKESGFPLSKVGDKEKSQGTNTWIILISLLMLSAFFYSYQDSQLANYIYFLATSVGLLPIARKAFYLARSGNVFSIHTLMTVASLGALYIGETAESAMILLLFLIGERLEAFATNHARKGVKSLIDLVPNTACIVKDGNKIKIPVNRLKVGDIIEVAPGGRLPTDAELLDDAVSFDESSLTGESLPVERYSGHKVMAGMLVYDKVALFKVVSEQGNNAIDRIIYLIEDAESKKAPIERYIDKFSRIYTPIMILLSLLIMAVPPLLFGQDWDQWLYKGLTVLLISCPCALVISIPATITSGLAAAAKRGALIKGGAALEQLAEITCIAFDKTGTLTVGRPRMTNFVCWGKDENELLSQVASIENGSLHPLAQAVVNEAKVRNLTIREANNRTALIGRGIKGSVDGKSIELISSDRLPNTIVLNKEQSNEVRALENEGKTLVVIIREEMPVGLIGWRDNLRDDAKKAITNLKNLGVQSIMLTGDNERTAQIIANKIGINFKAKLYPEDKVKVIKDIAHHSNIAMVGDGINDAPAMKAATIGIAMGSGSDVALDTADAALSHNRLSELPTLLTLSRKSSLIMRENIAISVGLKLVFLISTLFGFTDLWMAIIADTGATVFVTLNALRLLNVKSSEFD